MELIFARNYRKYITLSRNFARLFSEITRCLMLFCVYSWKFRLSFKYIRVITRWLQKLRVTSRLLETYFLLAKISSIYINRYTYIIQNFFWMMIENGRLKVLFLMNFLEINYYCFSKYREHILHELATNLQKNLSLCVRNNDVGCSYYVMYRSTNTKI